jgi:hypothetical protein
MKTFDVTNGHLFVVFPLEIKPGMDFEEMKQQLTESKIPFVETDSYNLFQFIYLNGIKFDNKTFHLEVYFDKKRLKAISFDFVCEPGYEISFEQWVAGLLGAATECSWGRLKADWHPKFDVPLIHLSYDLP